MLSTATGDEPDVTRLCTPAAVKSSVQAQLARPLALIPDIAFR